MEQEKNMTQEQSQNRNQGFFAEPRVFLSRDGEHLVIALPGNMLVRKHVNFYKKILGVPFTPKATTRNAV